MKRRTQTRDFIAGNRRLEALNKQRGFNFHLYEFEALVFVENVYTAQGEPYGQIYREYRTCGNPKELLFENLKEAIEHARSRYMRVVLSPRPSDIPQRITGAELGFQGVSRIADFADEWEPVEFTRADLEAVRKVKLEEV